jgi:hypothetical protein
MTNMSDFSPNLVRAIENGLSRDDALRALTIWPAEILGVSDRLGSIEAGKIANLTITRGDLFERSPRIAYLFIDGRQVDLRPPAPVGQPGSGAGTWILNVNLGTGDISVTLMLQQEGERLRGSIQGGLGSADISNASAGQSGDIRFTAPVTIEGQTAEATFTGKVTGNDMQGTVNVVGRTPGSFTGTRAGAPAEPTPSPTPAVGTESETVATAFKQRHLPSVGRWTEDLVRLPEHAPARRPNLRRHQRQRRVQNRER